MLCKSISNDEKNHGKVALLLLFPMFTAVCMCVRKPVNTSDLQLTPLACSESIESIPSNRKYLGKKSLTIGKFAWSHSFPQAAV